MKSDFKIYPAIPIIHVKKDIKKNVQKINDFFNFGEIKLSVD
jgi:hypothetical protein